jgi:hypothetical protein
MPSGAFQAWLHCLVVAKIVKSETTKSYFVHFHNISTDVYEFQTKKKCDEKIREVIQDFLNNCSE